MNPERNVGIDFLRIGASIGVLICHVCSGVGGEIGEIAAIGRKGVELFFVLSGFLCLESIEQKKILGTFIKRE